MSLSRRLSRRSPSRSSPSLAGRLHSMNRSLAYLTYAAEALGRDEYDAAFLDELTDQPGELANFARAFAGMAAEIRDKQQRRAEMRGRRRYPAIDPAGAAGARRRRRAVDLHAEMHPARDIGGDFYDYFLIDDERLVVTVADVSGKGIPAALFMAVSRTVLRASVGGRRHGGGDAGRQPPAMRPRTTACMFVTRVLRRARPGERSFALVQCRPQPALSAARRRRA